MDTRSRAFEDELLEVEDLGEDLFQSVGLDKLSSACELIDMLLWRTKHFRPKKLLQYNFKTPIPRSRPNKPINNIILIGHKVELLIFQKRPQRLLAFHFQIHINPPIPIQDLNPHQISNERPIVLPKLLRDGLEF